MWIRTKKHNKLWFGPLALLCLASASEAQTVPVDAGQLLEQQRRLEQRSASPPQRASPLQEGDRLATPGATGDAQVTVRTFLLSGNKLLSDDVLQALLARWTMRPITLATLRQAAAAVEQAYRDAGWLARVNLPRQDVTDGQVRLEISEGRMGRVEAVTTGKVSPGLVERARAVVEAHLPAGEPLNLHALERALLIADELPGVTASGSLRAGSTLESTDVLLQLAPTPLTHTTLTFDNGGNRVTGEGRFGANVTVDSPWGHGDQLGFLASKSMGTEYVRGAASLPFGPQGWRVGINASALHYHVIDEFNTTTGLSPRGSSQTFGADAQYPLVRSAQSHWNGTLNAEQRRQTNRDDHVTAGDLETASQTRIRALTFGLNGYAFDSLGGQTQAGVQFVLGSLSLAGSPSDHQLADAQTEDTAGHYEVIRWNAARVQTLTTSLSLSVSANGQFANRNLDSSEKLYLGGLGAVNAYPTGEAGGSEGQLVNIELRRQLNPNLQLIGFYDWGQVRQYQYDQRADGGGPLTTANIATLHGHGVALSWRGDNGLRVRASWAHRTGTNPLVTPNGSDTDGSLLTDRFWISASYSF